MQNDFKKYKERCRRRIKYEIYKKRKNKDSKYDIVYKKIFGEDFLKLFEILDLSIDHKYSIYQGFKNNVPSNIICCPYNLKVMSKEENNRKGSNCSITLKKLIEIYQQFLADFPEIKYSTKEDLDYIKNFENNNLKKQNIRRKNKGYLNNRDTKSGKG